MRRATAEELRVEDEYEPLVAALRATLDAARASAARSRSATGASSASSAPRRRRAVSGGAQPRLEDVARNRRLDEARGDAARRHDESRGAAAELERRLAAADAARAARTSLRRRAPGARVRSTAPRPTRSCRDGRLDDAHADAHAVFVVRAPDGKYVTVREGGDGALLLDVRPRTLGARRRSPELAPCAAPGGAPTHPLGGRTFKLSSTSTTPAPGPRTRSSAARRTAGASRAAYHEGDAMPLTLLPVEGRPHEYVLRGGAPAAYVSFADDGGWLHARYERRRDAMSVRLHLRTPNNAGTCRGDQFLLSNEFKPSKYAGKWISFSSNGNWLRCTYDRESDAMSVMLFPRRTMSKRARRTWSWSFHFP
ncbi:hypothetical protein SO694_00024343 [Aureococcus anophagefferens]|uniref:Fascin domain-containing protein n=1 Tax=Aureococcus anophagefferens TaxID=44056 RepID=A0ABR1FUX2_AURAN